MLALLVAYSASFAFRLLVVSVPFFYLPPVNQAICGPTITQAAVSRALPSIEEAFAKCPLLALSIHPTSTDECPLSGVQRT